ncbi:MAG: DUF2793 domain-containing protein [Rickettsiales bacterium]|nr:DUF2793 domain-containing protein [Rickettsiales bacterium]
MTNSNHLSLIHIEQNQAQKEITINEALNRIDAVLNMGAVDREVNTPPTRPNNGDVYIIGNSPTGAWDGRAGNIAYYDAGWGFIVPNEGMTLWVNDEDTHYSWNGSAWVIPAPTSFTSDLITFDTSSGSIQLKVNKDQASDSASHLFQTNFSSRAEFGLVGDDDFQVKVSPDGTTFYQAWVVNKDNGETEFKKDISTTGAFKHSEIRDYSETIATNSSATGAVTIDYNDGNICELTLTGNITSLTINNPPATAKAGNMTLILKQDATGSRTVSWPAALKWVGGVEPTLSTAANAIDIISLTTTDAGSTYFATSLLDFK